MNLLQLNELEESAESREKVVPHGGQYADGQKCQSAERKLFDPIGLFRCGTL